MSWINPKTWNIGELVTAAMMNKELRDRLNDLWKFVTKGDLLVATGPSDAVRLPVGTNGQVLKANSARTQGMEWGTDPAMDLFAAHGDLLYGTGNDKASRLPVGAIGEVLRVQGGEGVRWPAWGIDPVTDMAVAKGDLFVATGADTLVRLPRGSNGQVLMVDSGQAAGVKWASLNFQNFAAGAWGNPAWSGTNKAEGVYTYSPSQWNAELPTNMNLIHLSLHTTPTSPGANCRVGFCYGSTSTFVHSMYLTGDELVYSLGAWIPLIGGQFTIRVIGTALTWVSANITGYIV
jgi:hypothetical protein